MRSRSDCAARRPIQLPTPVSSMYCGLPTPEYTAFRVALKVAFLFGVMVSAIEQLLPAARLVPQVLVSAKSNGFVPVRLSEEMGMAAVPVLVIVAVCGALVVPFFTVPKLISVGDMFNVP